MRTGKLLLTAGFLFGLTVAANGEGLSNTGDSILQLEIVAPVTVAVNGGALQDLGPILAGGSVNDSAIVAVTATKGTVGLTVDPVTLKNKDQAAGSEDTIVFTPTLVDESLTFNSTTQATENTTINYKIDSGATAGKAFGLYEGTVTVTAAYN